MNPSLPNNILELLREKAETWVPETNTLDTKVRPDQKLELQSSRIRRPDALTLFSPKEEDYLTVADKQEQVPYSYADTPSRLKFKHPDISLPEGRGMEAQQIARYEADAPDIAPQNLDFLKTRLAKPEKQFQQPEVTEQTPRQPKYDTSPPDIPGKRLDSLFKFPNFAKTLPSATAALTHSPKPTQITTSTVKKSMPVISSPLQQKENITGNNVVVSLADKRVVVYSKDKKILASYPIYIGTNKDPTPQGQFRIMENITPGPSEWYYGGKWLGFAANVPNPNADYMGFHGWEYTKDDDEEEKVNPGWKTSTHGCVQLANKDIANFSKLLGAGDPVTIVNTHLSVPGVQKPNLPPMPTTQNSQSSVFANLFSKLGGK